MWDADSTIAKALLAQVYRSVLVETQSGSSDGGPPPLASDSEDDSPQAQDTDSSDSVSSRSGEIAFFSLGGWKRAQAVGQLSSS